MGVRVRDGLSPITSNIGNNNYATHPGPNVGKVYAVMLSPSSVPKQIWEDNGGWSGIGTILYQEYREGNEILLKDLTDEMLSTLSTALPFYPNQKYFPLPGEIVYLLDLPSAPSPITNKTNETYYLSPINAWNSPQFNGLFLNEDKEVLYNSFIENGEFRGLQTFEGDYILEGRFGNSIRFGSTNKSGNTDLSPWSTNPTELNSNPITLISTQHNFKTPGSDLNVEDINKDGSSIYLTSNQSIPLDIGNITLSSITNPIKISEYTNPQVIINADRTIVSSKADEVLIFGKTGVELYSQGPIYLQSANVGITLQDNQIYLGPYTNNSASPEPLVLGCQLQEWLSSLTVALSDFASVLGPTFAAPEGTLLETINQAATALQESVDRLSKKIINESLISKVTYTT
jgi:hypothetical protein